MFVNEKNNKPCILEKKIYFLKHRRLLDKLKTTETSATAVRTIFWKLFRQNPEAIYPNYKEKNNLDK